MGSEHLNASSGAAAELSARARRNEELNRRLRQPQWQQAPRHRLLNGLRLAESLGILIYRGGNDERPWCWSLSPELLDEVAGLLESGRSGFATAQDAAEDVLVRLYQVLGIYVRQRAIRTVQS